jgi:hypothetical protein
VLAELQKKHQHLPKMVYDYLDKDALVPASQRL